MNTEQGDGDQVGGDDERVNPVQAHGSCTQDERSRISQMPGNSNSILGELQDFTFILRV
jgi:hypothetical protein